MGRAGGGSRGGGGRSGGGSFSRSSSSFSRSSSSFSRSSGSSFTRSSSGRSGAGSYARSSSGSSSSGSFGSHSYSGSNHPNHGHLGTGFGGVHHRPRPIYINPGYGRKTVIINNSGNTTYTGTNTSTGNGSGTYTTNSAGTTSAAGTTTQQTYTAPKEITPEQKLARAERLAKEAAENKKGSVKLFFIALILLVVGVFAAVGTKREGFEKYNLKGTVDVGYAYDDGFTFNGGRTEAACQAFYEATGIPLYFYTVAEYNELQSCDDFTEDLYDKLFKDENHVLIAYYNNQDWWSWQYGANASEYMAEEEVNDLIDTIYYYWDDTSLSNDAVLAKGINQYTMNLTSDKGGVSGFAVLLCIGGLVVLAVAIYQYINYGSDAKKYEEEAKKIQREIILSKPLETFGNQEMDDLKNKYDNM